MEIEYQDLSLDCIIENDVKESPAERDVHDVGSWEEQPNGNILMSIDRYSLRRHLFLNGGSNRAKKMNSHSIYAFLGKFFAVVKVWKKDGIYLIIEFKELDISFVARQWVALTLWFDTPCFSKAAINRLRNYMVERIENSNE